MKPHNHYQREQRVPNCGSKSSQAHAILGSHGYRPSVTDAFHYSPGSVSQLLGYSNPSESRGRLPVPQWRPMESDQWSVDSPKESGYYSEESSVGPGSYMHQAELCKYPALHCIVCLL